MNAGKVTKIMDVYSNSHNFRDTKKPETYLSNNLKQQPFGFFRVLWGFVVIVVNVLIIFLMKSRVNNFAESVFLLLILLFALIILKGWNNNSGWAWPAMIIFLSLVLANNVYLFVVLRNIAVFIFLIMLNVWSIVLSMIWCLEKPLPQKTDKFSEEKDYKVFSPTLKTKRKKRR